MFRAVEDPSANVDAKLVRPYTEILRSGYVEFGLKDSDGNEHVLATLAPDGTFEVDLCHDKHYVGFERLKLSKMYAYQELTKEDFEGLGAPKSEPQETEGYTVTTTSWGDRDISIPLGTGGELTIRVGSPLNPEIYFNGNRVGYVNHFGITDAEGFIGTL